MENQRPVPACYYLFHSGFAIETAKSWLIFDYFLDIPGAVSIVDGKMTMKKATAAGGLSDGVIDPAIFNGKRVLVFISHGHQDHFNQKVFAWGKTHQNLKYIISDDIITKDQENPVFLIMGPRESRQIDDVKVLTLRSTDRGVGFLVEIDGYRFYHAGDHGNWVREGMADIRQATVQQMYTNELIALRRNFKGNIDLALVPVVPPFTGSYAFALTSLMRNLPVTKVAPMHFATLPGGNRVFAELLANPETASYRDKILTFGQRGERLPWSL